MDMQMFATKLIEFLLNIFHFTQVLNIWFQPIYYFEGIPRDENSYNLQAHSNI